ncbi:LpxI family protein [Methylopila henanensis]|uniref:LpxI family protein n=1 Tax=Methylopila henanensis TaxID=873516 RepID=A0ABW4K1U4_9HYPH
MTLAPLGLICGSGSLPLEVAEGARAAGRDVFLLALRGSADKGIERYPHAWLGLGEIGKLLKLLEKVGAKQLVLVGGVQRPALRDIRLDMTGLISMPEIRRLMSAGDDHLLSGVIGFLAARGYEVIGAHEAAPGLTASEGLLGARDATAADATSVAAGLAVLAALGPYDVGQAAVAIGRRIVAVEAAEGTDMMLRRVARLAEKGRIKREGRGGVLVKAPKPGQNLRVDLPAIGPRTIELAAAAGLTGVAVAAGGVLLAERARIVELADSSGLFLAGVPQAAFGAP